MKNAFEVAFHHRLSEKKCLELLIKEIKIRQHYFHKLYMEKELVYDKNYNEEMFASFL